MAKITIELNTGDEKDRELVSLFTAAMIADDNEIASINDARSKARELHAEKVSGQDNGENEKTSPDDRIYGEKGEKSRRTKEEMAEDEAIAERWAALWPSKDVPAKPVGELKAHLAKIESEQDLDEFDLGDEADEILDLEEFRGIIVKHSKTLGKKLGEIMAPYKNPGQVPEDKRRDYADKIIEAAGAE